MKWNDLTPGDVMWTAGNSILLVTSVTPIITIGARARIEVHYLDLELGLTNSWRVHPNHDLDFFAGGGQFKIGPRGDNFFFIGAPDR